MADVFTTSGENTESVAAPTPQLQGMFIPSIDNAMATDGLGIVTPWGGGGTARRYGDYGLSAEVSRQSTQLNDLATGFIPGGGATYNLEGFVGPQGPRGPAGPPGIMGLTSLPSGYVLPINSNFLAALPHNIDQINDLGTAADKLVYTESYASETEIGEEDLCTGTTDGDTLGLVHDYWLGGDTGWTERVISLTPSIDLVEGQQYAIIGRALDAPVGDYAYIFGQSVPPWGEYDGGAAYTSSDAGITWTESTGVGGQPHDIRFVVGSNSYVPTYYPELPYTGWFGVSATTWKAQTFTAAASETVSSVTLIMARGSSGYPERDHLPGTITVSIRNVTVLYGEATWAEADLTSAGRDLLDDATAAAQATTLGLGTGDSVTHDTLTLSSIAHETTDVDKVLVDSTGVVKYRTGAEILSDIGGQASDAGLTSIAGLTYVSASFVKMTGEDTFALRTLQQTSDDLEATIDHDNLLNFAANEHYLQSAIVGVGTIATGVWEATSIAVTYTDAKCTDATADNTAGNETSHADVLIDGDFASAGLMYTDGAGAYSIKAIGTDVQAYHANLAAIAAGTWVGASSITTLGTIATGIWEATDVAILHGGTGQSTAQLAINALSAVGAATNEHVLTKDTGTGNAIWKVAAGGAHTHDGDTLQLDGINSNGGAFPITVTGAITINAGTQQLKFDSTIANNVAVFQIGSPATINDRCAIRAIGGDSFSSQIQAINTAASSATTGGGVIVGSDDGAAMASGHRLGYFLFSGSRSATLYVNACGIAAYAAENWVDASAYGAKFQFETITNGATSRTAKLIIENDGKIGIGNPAPALAYNQIHVKTETDGGGITIQRNSTTADTYTDLKFLMSTTDSAIPTSYIRVYRRTALSDEDMHFVVGANLALVLDDEGGVHAARMRSGADQAAAGAAVGELWADTNDGNTVKLGV